MDIQYWFILYQSSNILFLFFKFIYLFWLRWVLVEASGIFSCGVRDLFILVAEGGLLSCGMRTLSCGMPVGSSSPTRDRTWAPCIASVES